MIIGYGYIDLKQVCICRIKFVMKCGVYLNEYLSCVVCLFVWICWITLAAGIQWRGIHLESNGIYLIILYKYPYHINTKYLKNTLILTINIIYAKKPNKISLVLLHIFSQSIYFKHNYGLNLRKIFFFSLIIEV
jgi:hypothetical protein